MSTINQPRYSTELEQKLAERLAAARILFIHSSVDPKQPFSFYLPEQKVFVQTGLIYDKRAVHSLALENHVIYIQGLQSFRFVESLLANKQVT